MFTSLYIKEFEELSCDSGVDLLKFTSECKPLNCTECQINFELREYNSDSLIQTYKGNKFEIDFEAGECNYYEIRAYISKTDFSAVPSVYKFNFNITPELVDEFTYNFDYNAKFLNFKIDNIWKKCVNSKLSVSVLNWLICERPALELFNYTNLSSNLSDIVFNTKGAFFNKVYTLEVQLEKTFGDQIVKFNRKIFDIESGN